MSPLRTIGLGGDGDEVDAIIAAFERFGVPIPVDDASSWVTAGDVWASLRRVLPGVENQPNAWLRFASALCEETGANPSDVAPMTRLLA